MKNRWKNILRGIFMIPVLLLSVSMAAQGDMAYEKAKSEIQATFGIFPTMFQVYPDYALAGAWDNYKLLNGPAARIPAKYKELLQLAVAAQIPCNYCIYFHTASAKANGATDDEIQEAIAHGAETREWSMILQGNQVDYATFRSEFDGMAKYMADKAKK